MTRDEIIQGLKFTVEMFLLDPSTGETYAEPRNDVDKITVDACKAAIELLKQKPLLDRIRAEIVSRDGLEEAVEIIDKCRAESEV